MRLERLELEGFTAYREPTEVDFSGADLFALTGPTGAGKSSLVDAVCFALYGVVPRYANRNLVAPVISEGKVEAKVRLDFSVGGVPHSAVRVVRAQRKGATTKEARLVRGDGEVLAGTADEVTEAVEALLGLSFAHFTTCVVLPQGEFMRFLHAKPGERQDLLVELLDLGLYGRMRDLAQVRRAAAGARRDLADQQLATWAPAASEEQRARLEAAVAALEDVLVVVDQAQPRLDALAVAAGAERAVAGRAGAEAAALAEVALPDEVARLGEGSAAARRAQAAAAQAEERAEAALAGAEAALAAGPARAELEAAARAHAERADLAARLARGEEVVAATARAAAEAGEREAAALAARSQAASALDAALRADRARELVLHLHVGEGCPVCGQEVQVVPTPEPAEVEAATAALARAEADHEGAAAAARTAAAERDRAEGLLATRREQLVEVDARLAGVPDPHELDGLLAAVAEAEAAVEAAREALAGARADRRRAEAAVEAARRAETGARARFAQVRDAVVPLGPPPAGHDDLVADWQALVAWAGDERPARLAQAAAATEAAERAEAEAAALVEEVVAACRAAGVDPAPARAAGSGAGRAQRLLRDVVVDELAEVRADLASVTAALAAVAGLQAERAAQDEAEQVAGALARHLGATGFEKWVLDEVLRTLVAAATGVLHELSGGAYSLTLDPRTSNFSVVDHANADAVRSARTLSGGETFLASLALALALADQVAQLAAGGAARLESLFLDEGFGTLDADTLDVVAAAIEELGARGRSVGLISHVPELAERLPVRFEVAKGPHGATVERVDA